MRVILASGSKRRQELMKMIKIPYEVIVCNDEEYYDVSKSLIEQCMDIAYHKAKNVYNQTDGERIVIGCDTVVIFDNKIYGKPRDKKEAFEMIKSMSGNYHQVVTALSILINKNNTYYEEKSYEETKVYIDNMGDDEINDWVNNNSVCDKAGSYAIQEEFGKYITKIEGDYYTIVGFPINKVYRTLNKYL